VRQNWLLAWRISTRLAFADRMNRPRSRQSCEVEVNLDSLNFSLVRFRENAESVALYGGEPVELRVFNERFRSVFENFRHIMKRQPRLTCFTLSYTQVAVIFPLVD